jgi:DNA-binding CsgD family transcriptional regulator
MRMPLRKPLMDTLDRICCGGVILDQDRQVLEINQTAKRVLEQELNGDECAAVLPQSVRRFLGRAPGCTPKVETFEIIQREMKRPLALHVMPLPDQTSSMALLLILDPEMVAKPNVAVLQKMFGLTRAEAKLAIEVSRGRTLIDIAHSNGTTVATARSQLAAVFAKTQTQRQPELVALLARVSILP